MEVVGTNEWLCGNKKVDSGTICNNGKELRQQVKQRIYSKAGDKLTSKLVDAGTMYLDNHPGHNHYHVDHWVEFRLVKMVKGKRKLICSNFNFFNCLKQRFFCFRRSSF